MKRVILRNEDGVESASFQMDSTMLIEVEFATSSSINPVLGVVVKTELGASVFGIDNRIVRGFAFDDHVGEGTITCCLENLPLTQGGYILDLYLGDSQRSLDCVRDAIRFNVTAADVFGTGKLPPSNCGPIYWPASWQLYAPSQVEDAAVD